MKKLIILITFFMIGCSENINVDSVRKKHDITIIDNCEYIIYNYSAGNKGYGYMAHKGNCKFCEQRRK